MDEDDANYVNANEILKKIIEVTDHAWNRCK